MLPIQALSFSLAVTNHVAIGVGEEVPLCLPSHQSCSQAALQAKDMPLLSSRWTTATAYVSGVVAVNVGFSHHPELDWFWSLLVGGVLALRDGAQRSWGHAVLLWMLVGAGLSYWLGNPAVAIASVSAFLISESVDWGVYTTTRRPFAERVWRSVLASSPVDTAVFLHLADLWSWELFAIGAGSKILAGALISLSLQRRVQARD